MTTRVRTEREGRSCLTVYIGMYPVPRELSAPQSGESDLNPLKWLPILIQPTYDKRFQGFTNLTRLVIP